MNNQTVEFIISHQDDDTSRLMMGKAPCGVDLKAAVTAIEARRKMRVKAPSWYAHPDIEYPSSLCVEQCSSEASALHKQEYVDDGGVVIDMTAGLGIDSWAFSRVACKVYSFEMNSALCEAQINNIGALSASNIVVTNAEIQQVDQLKEALGPDACKLSLIYVDPARRGSCRQRVYAFEDCTPNILDFLPSLLDFCPKVLIKGSPMVDISSIIRQIPQSCSIEVVSVGGECKEVLTLAERNFSGTPSITATSLSNTGAVEHRFTASLDKEQASSALFAASVGNYLFQPDKAILKAGFFKILCESFPVRKLDASTHLYTSGDAVTSFPGKCFEVLEVTDFNNRIIKSLRDRYPKAELSALNFPLDTAALRSRLRIADGGPLHIFACSVAGERKLIICR